MILGNIFLFFLSRSTFLLIFCSVLFCLLLLLLCQHVEVVTPSEKLRRLEQILRSHDSGSKILIFCTTKRMCDQLSRTLNRQFGAAAIHGDKSQNEREKVLSQFRSGRSPILVATDVAARGLDIKDIRLINNIIVMILLLYRCCFMYLYDIQSC